MNLFPNSAHFPLMIFISHSWRFPDRRDELIRLLKERWAEGVDFFDLSISSLMPVPVADENELLWELSRRLSTADVVFTLSGPGGSGHWANMERLFAMTASSAVTIPLAPFGESEELDELTEWAQGSWVPWKGEPVPWSGDAIRQAILDAVAPEVRQLFLDARELRGAGPLPSREQFDADTLTAQLYYWLSERSDALKQFATGRAEPMPERLRNRQPRRT